MLAVGRGDAGAQLVRGAGLALAGDVVEFALDRQQRAIVDPRRIDALAGHVPQAARQQVFLEHGADGVQVVLGRHVQHGVVFVVELAVRRRGIQVALQQVLVEIPVRGLVPLRVHRHETHVLQETRVHAATLAGIVHRYVVDHVVLEPRQRLAGGQVVDRGRGFAGIDRPAHHHHRFRQRLAMRRHQRDRGEHRHGRLADADHVEVVGADVADEVLHVGDVIVQVERALAGRDHARIGPVGDVDLVVGEQGLHGVAQQGRVVAGQRRHHQHAGVVLQVAQLVFVVGETLEAQQPAERFFQRHPFHDRDRRAIDLDLVDPELGLLVVLAEPVHQLEGGGGALRARQRGQPTVVGGIHLGAGIGEVRVGRQSGAPEFMQLVKQHAFASPCGASTRCRIAA